MNRDRGGSELVKRLIVSGAIGYAVCAWDASCHPMHERWPSAMALYLVLIARLAPGLSLWSGGLCGVIHDAAMGGRIGPGVIAATMAVGSCRWGDRDELGRFNPGQIISIAAAVLAWLVVPVVFQQFGTGRGQEEFVRLLSHQWPAAVSSILLALTVIAITPCPKHDE